MPRYGLKRLFLLLLIPASMIVILIATKNSAWVEEYFSRGLYIILCPAFTSLSGLFPFSVSELLIYGGILALIIITVRTVRNAVKDQDRRGYTVYTYVANIAVITAVLYACFVFGCGLNYYRVPFAQTAGLTVRESSPEELKALCTELVNKANTQSQYIAADENGETKLPVSDLQTADNAVAAMKSISKQYPFMRGLYSRPKPVLSSKLMSLANITGIYFPFTFEANVNVDVPDYAIPATMCHELAHQRGFMREDEANFISYMACRNSNNSYFIYSGTLSAISFAFDSLRGVDPAAYDELYGQLSEGIKQDFAAYNRYWHKYEGVVSQVSTSVNNAYLKANNQSDGVFSYGRMVDLMLAEYRQRNSLS
ncbi:DUF3810 domain-containing protein [Acetanaerobacterium elongatum]|uniref:DUF3810 domain-containing protein n=1 Tax=Acetanaerobacterium elongatum TaxID=258515 RepID=A0A1G9WME2_9FIRM|nr:DUF3810 domain-containing protein [Acetanaerobacterium elongatum]SDM85629.1 Protein of unknown function [Acetanaerobacterium elongatum]